MSLAEELVTPEKVSQTKKSMSLFLPSNATKPDTPPFQHPTSTNEEFFD